MTENRERFCLLSVGVPEGVGDFSLHHLVQTNYRAHQPPIQWVPRGSFPGGKAAGERIWPLTPSTAEVKNAWSYASIPPIRLHGVVLS
jgi:hypothetical protein